MIAILFSSTVIRAARKAFAAALLIATLQSLSAAPTITATQDDATNAATRKLVGETITYTTTINNTAPVIVGSTANDATGVTLTNPTPANTTDIGTVSISPVAFDDVTPQNVAANIAFNSGNIPYEIFSNDFLGVPAVTTIASFTQPAHGTVTMVTSGANIGRFTYEPAAGYTGTDSFTYTLTNAVGSSVGTVNLNVVGPVIWFVDDSAPAGGTGVWTGTNSKAFQTVTQAAMAIGTSTGHRIYLASGTYTNGRSLRADEWIVGEGASGTSFDTVMGITYGSGTVARPPINGTRPAWSAIAGSNVVFLANNNTILGVAITGNSATAVAGTSVTTGLIGNAGTLDTTITGVAGGAFALTGGSGAFNVNATISSSAGRPVSITGRGTGVVTFSRSITDTAAGTGILLDNNDASGNATITFTGGLSISTTSSAAFAATNGGVVNATQNNTTIVNTLTSTTGAALNVSTGTTIGASGLTFRSISSNGAANGIILNGTGATGGLTVTGNGGTCTSAATCTGGAIQGATNGILLTSTTGVSIDRMFVFNTSASGINGTGVNNFSLTNSKIDDSGTTGFDSNISFNSNPTTAANVTGTLTITGNTLTNAFYSCLDIQAGDGTITNANISNNVMTSTTSTATSQGFGININGVGTGSTAFALNNATISSNTITNFPTASGIQINGGNANATGPRGTIGIPGDASNLVSITSNSIQGQSIANRMGGSAIIVAVIGGNNTNATTRSRSNINISNNPTLTNIAGTVIGVAANGHTTMTAAVTNNTIVANQQPNFGGANGIGGGCGVGGAGAAWQNALTMTVTGNNISQTDGNGILLVNRATNGTFDLKITGNTVGAPINAGGTARQGIRVDSGNNTAGEDTHVCLNTSGNTSSGSNGAAGIGIRKQGTVQTVNDFGITGLSPSPATGPQAAAFVATQNPAGGGCDNISGSNFQSCATAPPLLFASGGVDAREPVSSLPVVKTDNVNPVLPEISSPAVATSALDKKTSRTVDQSDLSQRELDRVVAAAISRWSTTGLNNDQLATLRGLKFEVADLSNLRLGEADGNNIRVDSNAGGNGWFIDATAEGDTLFAKETSTTRSYTDPADAPAGRIDLLTAIMHEMGHALGLSDSYLERDRDNVMYGFLTKGERRLPAKGQAIGAKPDAHSGPHFLASPVNLGTLPPGKSVKIVYAVTVGPITGNPQSVSSQGTVTAAGGISVATDDLQLPGGAADPTVTLLGIPPTITSANAATFTTGTPGSFSVTANGAPPPSFSVTNGTLPGGVGLSPAGVLSGTPNAGTGGTYPIEITATNNINGTPFTSTQSFTLTVNQPAAITSANSTTFTVGTAGSFTVTKTGFPAPTLSRTGALPNGVTFVEETGVLSGTPAAGTGGTYPLTFTASNGVGSDAAQSFTLTVNEAPSITSGNSATFTVGTAGSFTVTTLGFPKPVLTRGGDALPSNLTFVSNGDGTATLSGMPNAGTGGVYNFTFTASNGIGSNATQSFTLTVNQAPNITSANSATFGVGNFGSFIVTRTGFPAPTLTIGGDALPSGVMFDPNNGLLSGTPGAGTAGTYQLTFTAANGVGSNSVQNFTLTVLDAACITPVADLIAWYPAEDNAIDVKNAHNGTVLNGAGYGDGHVGRAFTFDGTNAVVQVPDDAAWDFGANAFTIQTWVKFTTVAALDNLVAHSEGAGNVNKWVFRLRDGQLEFILAGSASAQISSNGSFTPAAGQWYHVAVTRSGNTYKFYVNGVQNGTDLFDSNSVPNATAPLTLGKAEAAASLNGSLDEAQIFSRALLASEILSVYNSSTEGFCVDALAATSAVSRKTHGGAGDFDVPLPLTGEPGVECRVSSPAGSHRIVVSFNNSVTEGNATVSAGAGSVSGTPTFTGQEMTINLAGVSNAQQITVSLSNVKDAFGQTLPSATVKMNVLAGDSTGNKIVTASDVSQTKALSGSSTNPTNFRNDFNTDGIVGPGDISQAKLASGKFIP